MATLRDAIYGLAVGDALGVPYEFRERDSFVCSEMVGYGTWNKPAGTFSDDTSMTLATCDSLRVNGDKVDIDDMRQRFLSWKNDGAYTVDGLFDIGGTTARALEAGYGMDGERDNGNGSLMRIAPLAFTEATDDEIAAVSAITHAHKTSTSICIVYVHILRELATNEHKEDIIEIAERVGKPRNEIRSGGYVVDTYDAALWCLANTSSYAECVLTAVNLGSDTDTTAAVAGALAGTLYGYENIPQRWIETLRGRQSIDNTLFL